MTRSSPAHSQWLVRHFSLWDRELDYIDTLLEQDVRNNSAWNHRYFTVFGQDPDSPVTSATCDREIQYAQAAISRAPQNQSPWNYLRGYVWAIHSLRLD